jgi:hypothetical protein
LQYGAPLPARTAVRSPLFAARCSRLSQPA